MVSLKKFSKGFCFVAFLVIPELTDNCVLNSSFGFNEMSPRSCVVFAVSGARLETVFVGRCGGFEF